MATINSFQVGIWTVLSRAGAAAFCLGLATGQSVSRQEVVVPESLVPYLGAWEYVASSFSDEMGADDARSVVHLLNSVASGAPDDVTRKGAQEWSARITTLLAQGGFTQAASGIDTRQSTLVATSGLYWREESVAGSPLRILQTLVKYGDYHADRQDRDGMEPKLVVAVDDPNRRPTPYLFQMLGEAKSWLAYAEGATDVKESVDGRVAVFSRVWDDKAAAGLTFPPWYRATVSIVAVQWKGMAISKEQHQSISLRDYQGLLSQELEMKLSAGVPTFVRKTVYFPFSKKRYYEIILRSIRRVDSHGLPGIDRLAASPTQLSDFHDTRGSSRTRSVAELSLAGESPPNDHGDKVDSASVNGASDRSPLEATQAYDSSSESLSDGLGRLHWLVWCGLGLFLIVVCWLVRRKLGKLA